ncbi:MAG: CRISPR-associated endonuclease Cas2 [Candidatus Yanofskybacteria bacterium RIFCSPHIGHO2_02_FULL_43_15c]|uniref:CRISPR-associated endoribonuclease Cas2 n=2 Tax=Candidatus Yanofskyibacteriota TaxID=1752733 RepID=A0A1F8H541_9BACT|nr:MAG: CRISPR-associated endonuclease Cas2 [Candidatus Yanofskybacteria bacterium RIFCSPHIGHO2_02_FULL_43_15c]OGN32675.1 MAG: CRISPR-associated endonuclease Cas2 [Candidatus Yanofskybacteria bacterium RIFCSPLOWO2_02_FULL_43_10b]
MKADFIPKFIEAVLEAGQELFTIWAHTSYKGFRPSQLYKGIKNLEQRGILKTSPQGFRFTRSGKEWFNQSLKRYRKLPQTKWDGRWRLVIFDIPQELHRNRNRFRRILKTLGFYMLQKSVFVFPYPCEKVLKDTCKELKIGEYVDILNAETIGFKEKDIRKFFNLET